MKRFIALFLCVFLMIPLIHVEAAEKETQEYTFEMLECSSNRLRFKFAPIERANRYKIYVDDQSYEKSTTYVNISYLKLKENTEHKLVIVPIIGNKEYEEQKYEVTFTFDYEQKINKLPSKEYDYTDTQQTYKKPSSQKKYRLIILKNVDGGRILPRTQQYYKAGETIKLDVHPYKGYKLVGWEGDVKDNEVVMDSHKTIRAIFENVDNRYVYSLNVKPNLTRGGITLPTYKRCYYGEKVALMAFPKKDYRFVGWDLNGDKEADTNKINPAVEVTKGMKIVGMFEKERDSKELEQINLSYAYIDEVYDMSGVYQGYKVKGGIKVKRKVGQPKVSIIYTYDNKNWKKLNATRAAKIDNYYDLYTFETRLHPKSLLSASKESFVKFTVEMNYNKENYTDAGYNEKYYELSQKAENKTINDIARPVILRDVSTKVLDQKVEGKDLLITLATKNKNLKTEVEVIYTLNGFKDEKTISAELLTGFYDEQIWVAKIKDFKDLEDYEHLQFFTRIIEDKNVSEDHNQMKNYVLDL